MVKVMVGKNLLDKEPILTGNEPPKIIGITEQQYYEYEKIQQENKQLKNNWNKLKEWSKHERKVAVGMQSGYGTALCDCMINKMQELEKGDNNE